MPSLKSIFFILITLNLIHESKAQTVINGDFEMHQAVTSRANLTNQEYNNLVDYSYSFGTYNGPGPNGGQMDLLTHLSGWSDSAFSGSWFVSFTAPGDEISLELSDSLYRGNWYTLTLYDRASRNGNGSPLVIGVSSNPKSFGSQIFVGDTPISGVWTKRTLSFQAPLTGKYITFTNQLPGVPPGSWTNLDLVEISNCVAGIELGPDLIVCDQDSIVIEGGNSSATYLWNDSSTNPFLVVHKTGEYWVEIQSPCGTARDTIKVQFSQKPNLDLGPDQRICTGDSILLELDTTFKKILWSNGKTGHQTSFSEEGWIWCRVENEYCSSVDSIRLKLENVSLELGNDTTLCEGENLVLSAVNSNSTYLWSTGTIDSILRVSTNNNIWVNVNNAYCGVLSDTISVKFLSIPNPKLKASDTICSGDTLIIKIPTTKFRSSVDKFSWVFSNGNSRRRKLLDYGTKWEVHNPGYTSNIPSRL